MFAGIASFILIVSGLCLPGVFAPLPNRAERASQPTVLSFYTQVKTYLATLYYQLEARGIPVGEEREVLQAALQEIRTNVERLASTTPVQLHNQLLVSLTDLLQLLTVCEPVESTPGFEVGKVTGGHGRPGYSIQRHQLEFLLTEGFSLNTIVREKLLGQISKSTLIRRVKKFKLDRKFTEISDSNLNAAVREIQEKHPNAGFEETRAYLKVSAGINIQRRRVRTAVRGVNPVGVATRWAARIRRRRYHSKGPNSVWHIDTHHALIRYKNMLLAPVFI